MLRPYKIQSGCGASSLELEGHPGCRSESGAEVASAKAAGGIKWWALSIPSEFERVRVMLVATRNPLNIGAVARAMSNFGFFRLCLVNPYEPSFLEARSAVGAAELLANAKVFATVGEAVADCTLVVGTTAVGSREIRQPLKFLEEGARAIHKSLRSQKSADAKKKSEIAILFGSEKFGLSNEDLSHCNWLLRIPTRRASLDESWASGGDLSL